MAAETPAAAAGGGGGSTESAGDSNDGEGSGSKREGNDLQKNGGGSSRDDDNNNLNNNALEWIYSHFTKLSERYRSKRTTRVHRNHMCVCNYCSREYDVQLKDHLDGGRPLASFVDAHPDDPKKIVRSRRDCLIHLRSCSAWRRHLDAATAATSSGATGPPFAEATRAAPATIAFKAKMTLDERRRQEELVESEFSKLPFVVQLRNRMSTSPFSVAIDPDVKSKIFDHFVKLDEKYKSRKSNKQYNFNLCVCKYCKSDYDEYQQKQQNSDGGDGAAAASKNDDAEGEGDDAVDEPEKMRRTARDCELHLKYCRAFHRRYLNVEMPPDRVAKKRKWGRPPGEKEEIFGHFITLQEKYASKKTGKLHNHLLCLCKYCSNEYNRGVQRHIDEGNPSASFLSLAKVAGGGGGGAGSSSSAGGGIGPEKIIRTSRFCENHLWVCRAYRRAVLMGLAKPLKNYVPSVDGDAAFEAAACGDAGFGGVTGAGEDRTMAPMAANAAAEADNDNSQMLLPLPPSAATAAHAASVATVSKLVYSHFTELKSGKHRGAAAAAASSPASKKQKYSRSATAAQVRQLCVCNYCVEEFDECLRRHMINGGTYLTFLVKEPERIPRNRVECEKHLQRCGPYQQRRQLEMAAAAATAVTAAIHPAEVAAYAAATGAGAGRSSPSPSQNRHVDDNCIANKASLARANEEKWDEEGISDEGDDGRRRRHHESPPPGKRPRRGGDASKGEATYPGAQAWRRSQEPEAAHASGCCY